LRAHSIARWAGERGRRRSPRPFSADQRQAEGFSVHADADEHSRILFLRSDLVSPSVKDARPVVGRNFADLVALAKQDGWPGYFGTPAIATRAAGERAMNAIAQSAIDAALKILDGAPDSAFLRVAVLFAGDADVQKTLSISADHERQIERRQSDWLAKNRR
jgi:hypothetical protein